MPILGNELRLGGLGSGIMGGGYLLLIGGGFLLLIGGGGLLLVEG